MSSRVNFAQPFVKVALPCIYLKGLCLSLANDYVSCKFAKFTYQTKVKFDL